MYYELQEFDVESLLPFVQSKFCLFYCTSLDEMKQFCFLSTSISTGTNRQVQILFLVRTHICMMFVVFLSKFRKNSCTYFYVNLYYVSMFLFSFNGYLCFKVIISFNSIPISLFVTVCFILRLCPGVYIPVN